MAKPNRKLAIETTDTGFPPHEDAIIKEALAQYRSALCQNWPFIKEVRDGDDAQTVSFSFGVRVNAAAKRPIVTGRLTFAKRWTDDTEGVVEDPNQKQLQMD